MTAETDHLTMRIWRRSVLQIDKRLAQFHGDWTRRSPASSTVGIRRFEPPDRGDDYRGTVGEYLVSDPSVLPRRESPTLMLSAAAP